MKKQTVPLSYTLEDQYAAEGYSAICGTDEAGRGCLAGPVVAAACILPRGLVIDGLNDSKKLSPARREALFDVICASALSYGIAEASVEEIDSTDILSASQLAMRRAVSQLSPAPDLVLVDGNVARGFPMRAVTVVHGDSVSPSIAAASILAKVYRDRLMAALDAQYPEYGFAKHKAYCTAEHEAAIRAHGISPCHRKTFMSFLGRERGSGTKRRG